MLGLKINFSGVNDVKKKLQNLVDDDKIEALLENIAIDVNNEAKILCPFRTGNLKASITYVPLRKYLWGVGTNVEYAEYVERGTYKMRERPYLRPALDIIKARLKAKGMVVF